MDATKGREVTVPTPSRDAVSAIIGKRCWRKAAGESRSLSLGLGGVAVSVAVPNPREYGEWEIGTYNAAWRVTLNGDVLCGSKDAGADRDRANKLLAIDLGSVLGWDATVSSVRFRFTAGYEVEFLRVNSDQDEWFHLFGPGDMYVELSGCGNWVVGISNSPWPG